MKKSKRRSESRNKRNKASISEGELGNSPIVTGSESEQVIKNEKRLIGNELQIPVTASISQKDTQLNPSPDRSLIQQPKYMGAPNNASTVIRTQRKTGIAFHVGGQNQTKNGLTPLQKPRPLMFPIPAPYT
ncbi:MAG: hypothetical protein EZS28_019642 [Streblomastix strix]|uniref:Uncharacterized protein n=1 Tax=Streblomastix strix TaxID=222440 RepID=A0A5J4VQQ7_9EUKA|nr:MAG: hypothetical protein EZS28_019642 [Streblomastix strix]